MYIYWNALGNTNPALSYTLCEPEWGPMDSGNTVSNNDQPFAGIGATNSVLYPRANRAGEYRFRVVRKFDDLDVAQSVVIRHAWLIPQFGTLIIATGMGGLKIQLLHGASLRQCVTKQTGVSIAIDYSFAYGLAEYAAGGTESWAKIAAYYNANYA